MARSVSLSARAVTLGKNLEGKGGPYSGSFSIGVSTNGPFGQSKSDGFVTENHINQRAISDEARIFRLFLKEGFLFVSCPSPTFFGSGMVACW